MRSYVSASETFVRNDAHCQRLQWNHALAHKQQRVTRPGNGWKLTKCWANIVAASPEFRHPCGNIYGDSRLSPFKPEFTVVIFIHYKPRIAVAIHDLQWMKMIWCGLKIKVNHHVLVNQFHGNFNSKTLCFRKIKSVFRDVKRCFNASWGLKELSCQRQHLCHSRSSSYFFCLTRFWQEVNTPWAYALNMTNI